MIRTATSRKGGVLVPQTRVGNTIHPEAARWAERVAANSGTLGAASLAIASRFMWEVENRTWKNKLLWIAPMLGSNLAAARTPLRDWLGGGLMANTAFVDGDFAETTGLQGNGSSKVLNTGIRPAQLGRGLNTSNGGIGYWELSINAGGTTTGVMGCIETDRYYLDLRTATATEFFGWGSSGNMPNGGVIATSVHYYGQRSSATRRDIFRSGVSVANNTTNDAAGNAPFDSRTIRLLGLDSTGTILYNAGRCGLSYMTDGSLTDAEALDMHNCLNTYLKTASGK